MYLSIPQLPRLVLVLKLPVVTEQVLYQAQLTQHYSLKRLLVSRFCLGDTDRIILPVLRSTISFFALKQRVYPSRVPPRPQKLEHAQVLAESRSSLVPA